MPLLLRLQLRCLYICLCSPCSKELERMGLGEDVDLHVCEVPVEYQAVQSLLPSLWKDHQPQVFGEMHSTVHKNMYFSFYCDCNVIFIQTNLCHLVLRAVSGPCWSLWVSHHRHSGAVRPQQGLQTPGQLQILPSLSLLHGERPRLHTVRPGHGESLQEGQRLSARGHSVCVWGCWKVPGVTLYTHAGKKNHNLFTADMVNYQRGKNTGGINNINDGCIPFRWASSRALALCRLTFWCAGTEIWEAAERSRH